MLKKLKPLHIYLIGAVIGLMSGALLRPINATAHAIVIILAIGICIFGIVRHIRR